ncbi:reticulocyte binding protein [Lactiplantibacillus plantarum]|nr:phage tail protein [Lactiplantibacillus plantarum]VDH09828.1 reticulocyte binding protein [Lactiplantibacillus plantarum]
MIKFHDPAGTPHFGQATITRTTSVNGGLSLTGEVFAGGDVLNGLDYGWWLNFDNEKYVITYKKLSDDTNTVVFDAVQQFFWDFAKVALHAQYTGSHEYTFYLGQLFDKSGYTYKNDVTVPAFEKENWGYKNKLDLFNDIIDQAGVEFEVHNETVHIAKQIGSDLTSFARKGINLSDLTEEMKISDFATYAKGYGAFKDAEDQSKGRLEVEYRSELAKQFGDLKMDPIVDERYTIADNLIAALKKQVDATYTVSMTMNIYDLENAGYPNYEAPKVGDWILAIDEALNFKRKIRIIQLEEQFDVTGKRIGYTATCGDLSIVDQYTHLQSSLDSKVQRIQESVDNAVSSANGKSTNYYGAKEPTSANEGDLWFDQSDSDPDKWSIKQWVNGRWEQITLNPGEVDAKVDVAKKEAGTAVENAKSASDKADQLAAKYDDTNALANQALDRAIDAQNSAAGLIDDVNKASQNADDAKSIANSVNSKYTTLTDGSTMTIAELENGLAAKLTKDDLSGYATETWTQNQIKVTADGINSTLSSVKTTVDGQTTSLNNLKADSSGFKAQFVTVNDTLGKQTKDIGTLQATNKSLTAGFDSLNADNTVNQHNISQLQLTATSLSNTIENVNQKVEDGLISTNIFRSANDFSRSYWTDTFGYPFTTIQTESRYHDSLIHYQGQGKTPAPYSTIAQQTITDDAMAADTWYTLSFYARGAGDNNTVGKFGVYFYGNGSDQSMSSSDGVEVLGTSDTHCIITLTPYFRRYVITFHTPKDLSGGHSFWARNDLDLNDGSLYCDFWHPKLELGKVASDFSVNPADTATISALSSISQTVDAIQTTVRGKVDNDTYQSKMTQLDNQITTKVSQGDITNENILPYSGYWSDLTGWELMPWGASDRNLNLVHHSFYHNAVDATLCVETSMADTVAAGSTRFNVMPNTTYTMTFLGFASANVKSTAVYVLGRTFASTNDYDYVHVVQGNLIMSPTGINKYTATFTTNSDETQAYVRLDNMGSSDGQSSGAFFAELKIERGDTATPYTRISSSEMQIASDNINLKVSKDGVINAIDVSKEGIQIYGDKLHITADTYIDNAIIKSAMIESINAEKIRTGTLDATKVNIIHLNANNITAGTIRGTNLTIGLNSGDVEFQAGHIHSADNAIDININNKYISVANNTNRVMLKNGEMQFVEPSLFDTENSPYFRIHNRGGLAYGGAEMVGRDYVAVSNDANSNDYSTYPIGVEEFSGLFTGYDRVAQAWRPTKIAGAERGVVISGGSTFDSQFMSASPHIIVGYDNGTKLHGGNRILFDAEYVHSYSTYKKTTSQAPNVVVNQDGALVRSTSASKYKANIVRGHSSEYGNKLINLPTATWIDKASVKRYNEDPSQPVPSLNYGMIAEDLADAGLEYLVVRNDEGELEGIQYDRIAVALLPLLSEWKQIIDNQEKEINELKKEQ